MNTDRVSPTQLSDDSSDTPVEEIEVEEYHPSPATVNIGPLHHGGPGGMPPISSLLSRGPGSGMGRRGAPLGMQMPMKPRRKDLRGGGGGWDGPPASRSGRDDMVDSQLVDQLRRGMCSLPVCSEQ